MARIELEHPFAEIHGTIGKKGIIHRQKKYRDERGRVIFECKKEAYVIKNPRDLKSDPRTEAELANVNNWKEACQRAAQLFQSARPGGPTETELLIRRANHIPDYYTPEEAQTLLASFKERFNAQIPATRGKQPDPMAPLDNQTGAGKRYAQFPAFLRAMLYHEMKNH